MAKFTKGKSFKKGKKTVMYIYKGGKKAAKTLVAVNHKLARGDVYVKAATLGYVLGRNRR